MDSKIYIHTALESKKVEALKANPLVPVLVESGEHYFTLKSAIIIGECEVIEDQGWYALNEPGWRKPNRSTRT